MGQLRTAARAYTLEGSSPATILGMVNRLALAAGFRDMATALCVAFDPSSGHVRIANAGHLPPLLVSVDGVARRLEVKGSLPLNVEPGARYTETEHELAPGDTLLLYTDGLVERKHQTLLEGLRDLERVAAEAPSGVGPLCDHIAERVLGDADRSDDVALLALQALPARGEPLHLRVPARPEMVAAVRRSLRRWLERAGASAEEVQSVTLAVGEACANSVEHAYGPGDAELEVEARVEAGVLNLTVRDFGQWRAPRGEHRGRGLALMRSTMDDVAVTHDAAGTVVEMSLTLKSGAEAAPPPTPETAAAAPAARSSGGARASSLVQGGGLRLSRDDEVVIAAFEGEIDIANAQEVFGRITAALDNRARGLVLDLSRTIYIDSSGLQALLELDRRTRVRGQKLRVVAPPDSAPRRVLELVRAHDSMPLHGALAEALSGFPRA
jgi:anti-anti-sigma factor